MITRIEVYPPGRYHRDYMAVVWCGGTIYQVYSNPSKTEAQADAEHCRDMLRKGLQSE